MSKHKKQVARILAIPSDYTFSECATLLKSFGYEEHNKGKTSGSRVRFYRKTDGHIINLHKPHPGDIMGRSTVRAVLRSLIENGDIAL